MWPTHRADQVVCLLVEGRGLLVEGRGEAN